MCLCPTMEVHFLTQADVMGLEQNLGLHAHKKLMISGGNLFNFEHGCMYTG